MKTRFLLNNTIIGLSEIVCRIPLIFTVGYLARKIGAEAYGSWVLVLLFLGFLGNLAGLGLSAPISRLVPSCSPAKALGFLKLVIQSIGLCLFIMLFLTMLMKEAIGRVVGIPPEFQSLLIIGLLFVAGNTAEAMLDAYFKARALIRRQIALTFTRSMIEVIVVGSIFGTELFAGATAIYLLAAYIVAVFSLKLLVYPLLAFRGAGHAPEPIEAKERRDILRYGLTIMPAVLAMWLSSQGDRLVLSHLVDKADLGIYAFGAVLAVNLSYLGYAVYPLLLPNASHLFDKGDIAGIRKLFDDSQRVLLVLLVGALTLLALFSREIILWTAGAAFINSAKVLLILAMAISADLLFGIYQYVFHLVKKPKLVLWLNIGNTFVLFVSIYVAARFGGITFVPWTVMIVAMLYNGVRYLHARQYMQVAPSRFVVAGYFGGLVCAAGGSVLADTLGMAVRFVAAVAIVLAVLAVLRWELLSKSRQPAQLEIT